MHTSYNTGYQQGDIKGAFLSDTDTTNVTGEILSNGDFTNGTTGWTLDAGEGSISVSSNRLDVTIQMDLSTSAASVDKSNSVENIII